jgi:hypothetical protein
MSHTHNSKAELGYTRTHMHIHTHTHTHTHTNTHTVRCIFTTPVPRGGTGDPSPLVNVAWRPSLEGDKLPSADFPLPWRS